MSINRNWIDGIKKWWFMIALTRTRFLIGILSEAASFNIVLLTAGLCQYLANFQQLITTELKIFKSTPSIVKPHLLIRVCVYSYLWYWLSTLNFELYIVFLRSWLNVYLLKTAFLDVAWFQQLWSTSHDWIDTYFYLIILIYNKVFLCSYCDTNYR